MPPKSRGSAALATKGGGELKQDGPFRVQWSSSLTRVLLAGLFVAGPLHLEHAIASQMPKRKPGIVSAKSKTSAKPATPVTLKTVGDCAALASAVLPVTRLDEFLTFAKRRPARDLAKGEFEKTSDFNSRLSEYERQDSRIGLVILQVPINRDYLRYDADKQILSVESSAFQFAGMKVILRRTEKSVGQYNGSNLFGVSVPVEKIHRDVLSFENDTSKDRMFYRLKRPEYSWSNAKELVSDNDQFARIRLNPERARKFKSDAAAYIAIQYPRLSVNSYSKWISPKIDAPFDVTEYEVVVSGSISCAAIGHSSEEMVVFDWDDQSSRESFISGGILEYDFDLGTVTRTMPEEPPRSSVITRPDWARKPSGDDLARYYPDRARRMEVSGRATLSCTVTARGALEGCSVVAESPADMGFGDAAIRLSSLYRMKPKALDGTVVDGGQVTVPIVFQVPQ